MTEPGSFAAPAITSPHHFTLMTSDPELGRVRLLYDAARRILTDGKVFVTRGISALPVDLTPDNDPHGEHDFGAFERRRYEHAP